MSKQDFLITILLIIIILLILFSYGAVSIHALQSLFKFLVGLKILKFNKY